MFHWFFLLPLLNYLSRLKPLVLYFLLSSLALCSSSFLAFCCSLLILSLSSLARCSSSLALIENCFAPLSISPILLYILLKFPSKDCFLIPVCLFCSAPSTVLLLIFSSLPPLFLSLIVLSACLLSSFKTLSFV